jgi:HPt (histidine-containing phosphotransfer) domain-containing protein
MKPSALQRVEQGDAPADLSSPIDHAHLARYTFGNRALEIEVLKLFAEQAPTYLEQLGSAKTEKAWRDAAHTLKGSARAVGAFAVALASERAEALKASTDVELRRRAVAEVADALTEVCGYIGRLEV